jgi:O-antigen ligase
VAGGGGGRRVQVVRVAELHPVLWRMRPSIIVATISVAILAAHTKPSAHREVLRDPQVKRLLAYIAVALAMIPMSLWPGNSINVVRNVLIFDMMIVASILLCAPTRQTLDRLITSFVAATTLFAVVVSQQGATVEGTRLSTIGSYDANDLAALLGIALPMACGLIIRRNTRWHRIVGLVAAPILCYAITATGSRGGLIAMVVGAVVLLLGFNVGRLVPAALALALATPVIWNAAPETFRTRARSILVPEEDYNTTSTAGASTSGSAGVHFFVTSPIIAWGRGTSTPAWGGTSSPRGSPAPGTRRTTRPSRCSSSSA